MTVKELIELLGSFPQDLEVIHSLYSEQCLLEARDVILFDGCEPRPDGWVQNARHDKPKRKYLRIF